MRAARAEPQRLSRALATGALAGGLALAVHSLFDFNLHLPSNALVASALAAVLLAPATDAVPSRPLRLLTIGAVALGLSLALTTPWSPARFDAGVLLRAAPSAAASLRREALARDLVAHLHRRPADASAWLALAWLNQTTTGAPARPLAAWAVRLDPTSRGVRDAAARLHSSSD